MTTDRQVRKVAVARIVADETSAHPDVLALDAGAVGEMATYGDSVRIGGVRVRTIDPPHITIRLVVRYPSALGQVAEAVRARVVIALDERLGLPGARVDVRIVDVREGSTQEVATR